MLATCRNALCFQDSEIIFEKLAGDFRHRVSEFLGKRWESEVIARRVSLLASRVASVWDPGRERRGDRAVAAASAWGGADWSCSSEAVGLPFTFLVATTWLRCWFPTCWFGVFRRCWIGDLGSFFCGLFTPGSTCGGAGRLLSEVEHPTNLCRVWALVPCMPWTAERI